MRRLVSSLIATVIVAALAASAGTASTRRFAMNDGAQSVSANWSGYTLQDANAAGLQFTSVTGTWTVPVTTCDSTSTASAAFWVGLGGSSDTATGLEQTGTGADCSNGTAKYYAWYEILPAASVEVPLKVKPGDQITTSVNVNGTTTLVQIKNRTRKTSFTKALTVDAPDLTSAEWIAEAPSACSNVSRCTVLPLANFGTVNFTRAAAIASAHPGTIADPTWANVAISLVPQSSSRFFAARDSSSPAGATPGVLSSDGRSFPVSWVANATG
ncbi:MAG TPA: G1 family glutamic endopeptidase [Gaiellaceae bacterium]